jgi:hypothetical protein
VPAGHPAGHRGSPEDLVRVLPAEGIRDCRVLAAFREVSRIPAPLVAQLTSGGRLVADARLTPAYLVPLVGTHGLRGQEGRDQR